MSLHPGFKALVTACKDDPSALESLAKKVNEASEASRSCDTANIKKAIFGYIFENPYQGSHWVEIVQEPLVPGDDKGARGFHHVETAALLCPLRLLDEFEEDPNIFMTLVQDGNIDITADDLPTFLYELGTSYNEDDKCTGLFRGHVLVRVYRHLFTGERSALNPKGGATKNKSRKFKLEEVTPHTIAYASVQTYIALASMPQWGRNDKSLFDLEDFYENIVDMFEGNADAPWVIETLEWWNEQVPGLRPKSSKVKKNKLAGSRIRTRPRPADRITAHLQQNPVLNQHVKSGTTQTLDRQGHEMQDRNYDRLDSRRLERQPKLVSERPERDRKNQAHGSQTQDHEQRDPEHWPEQGTQVQEHWGPSGSRENQDHAPLRVQPKRTNRQSVDDSRKPSPLSEPDEDIPLKKRRMSVRKPAPSKAPSKSRNKKV